MFCFSIGVFFGDHLDASVRNGFDGTDVPLLSVELDCLEDTLVRQKRCAQYFHAVGEHILATKPLFLSGTLDKSRVHCFGLVNGIFATNDNTAWWAVPQDRLLSQGRYPTNRPPPDREKKRGVCGGGV